MNGVLILRRLTHVTAAGIVAVCVMHMWSTFAFQPTDPTAKALISFGTLAAVAATGLMFLLWSARARNHLLLFKGEARSFTVGWVVGAWFIPVVNLILPALVIADLARGSTTEPAVRRKLQALVWAWWICLIGGQVMSVRSVRGAPFQLGQLIGSALYLAAGYFVVELMYQIVRAQQARFSISTGPDPADFPTFTVGDVAAHQQAADVTADGTSRSPA